MMLDSEKITQEWKKSVLISIFENKSYMQIVATTEG